MHAGLKLVSGPQTTFWFTHAVWTKRYLIASWKVVCAMGMGFAVLCASISAQTFSGCEGIGNLISNRCPVQRSSACGL